VFHGIQCIRKCSVFNHGILLWFHNNDFGSAFQDIRLGVPLLPPPLES